MERKKLKVAMFPHTQVLDVVGPVSVFEGASNVLPDPLGYDVELVASEKGPIETSGCLSLEAHETFDNVSLDGVSTLLVPGGSLGTPRAMRDTGLRRLVEEADRRGIRLASICTGAFILAEAGVFEGRKCTTHWSDIDKLRRLFPTVDVLDDVIYHTEDHIWTSAGVATGIDMALAMVAEDYGRSVALKVARNLILYMARPGDVKQLSEFVINQPSIERRLEDLVFRMKTSPHENYDVTSMAEQCNMSARTFTRKFKDRYGKTPAAMVREVRVARAEFYMQTSEYNQKRIARMAGFSSVDVMRQAMNTVRRARAGSSIKLTRTATE